jgi:hypothetical protein
VSGYRAQKGRLRKDGSPAIADIPLRAAISAHRAPNPSFPCGREIAFTADAALRQTPHQRLRFGDLRHFRPLAGVHGRASQGSAGTLVRLRQRVPRRKDRLSVHFARRG